MEIWLMPCAERMDRLEGWNSDGDYKKTLKKYQKFKMIQNVAIFSKLFPNISKELACT